MVNHRRIRAFLTYGLAHVRGKVAAAFLLTASPVWAEPVTVLALGDSLTQGYGLPAPDGFVPQLQAWLTAEGADVMLINGGVSGDTTAGGAARVDWSLTPDVDAMIVALGANDFLRGIDPAVTRANLSAILDVAQGRGIGVLLIGMPAPGNFGPDYKQAFDAIYPDLAGVYETLHFESFFKGLSDLDPSQTSAFFQPDGLHPNAEGVARIVEALGPAVLVLVESSQ